VVEGTRLREVTVHLTRESEYALLGIGYLATAERGRHISVAEAAEARGIPAQFLSKIFQKLARAEILVGGRGRGRGYVLARPPAEITMGEILAAVEGPESLQGCLLWQGYCGDANPCPLHHTLRDTHHHVRGLVGAVTIADYLARSEHRAVRS
jgi:Rrf2 family transcriptional regulator, iron-sulfur cluster assembly transcription factor